MWDSDPENSEPVEREVFLFGDAVLLARAVEHDEDGEPKKLQFDRIVKVTRIFIQMYSSPPVYPVCLFRPVNGFQQYAITSPFLIQTLLTILQIFIIMQ